MTQLVPPAARAWMAPEVTNAASSASVYLSCPSLERFDGVTIALRCTVRHVARRIGGRRVHDLCHVSARGRRRPGAPRAGGEGLSAAGRQPIHPGPRTVNLALRSRPAAGRADGRPFPTQVWKRTVCRARTLTARPESRTIRGCCTPRGPP